MQHDTPPERPAARHLKPGERPCCPSCGYADYELVGVVGLICAIYAERVLELVRDGDTLRAEVIRCTREAAERSRRLSAEAQDARAELAKRDADLDALREQINGIEKKIAELSGHLAAARSQRDASR
jgi:ATP phosphoribosyltransferase